MTERALTFGSVAEAYERCRPDALPPEVDVVGDMRLHLARRA